MGCILVLFPVLWKINVQFTNFRFLNFLFSNIAILVYFDPKLPFFFIEISLKLHLHTKYWMNNPNSSTLGLKSPKFNHIFSFLGAQKFIAYTNIQIHVTRSIFIENWCFLNAHNNILYENQWQLKLPKNTYSCHTILLMVAYLVSHTLKHYCCSFLYNTK